MNSDNAIIVVPPTTSITVIFPFNAADKKFDSSFYSPALTDGRASFEEISQFLAEIEAVRPTAASQGGPSACRLFCLFLLLILWIARFILQTHMNVDLIPFAIVFVVILVIFVIIILVLSSGGTRNESQAKCQAIVEKYNQNLASRGLRWYLPVSFPQWVELWKDYPQNQGAISQPISMPSVNQQPYYPVQNYGIPNQNYQGQGNNNIYTPPSQF